MTLMDTSNDVDWKIYYSCSDLFLGRYANQVQFDGETPSLQTKDDSPINNSFQAFQLV